MGILCKYGTTAFLDTYDSQQKYSEQYYYEAESHEICNPITQCQ